MIQIVSKAEAEQITGLTFSYLCSKFVLHWTDAQDTYFITNLMQGRQKILEIGTHLGYTTQNIARCFPDSEITTIDICKDMSINCTHQTDEILDREKSGSVATGPNIKKYLVKSDDFFQNNKEKFDAIFIDGDHSIDQVAKDSEHAFQCAASGGIIIWHDVYNRHKNCYKSHCQPDNMDVVNYLDGLERIIYKIENSWVGFTICPKNIC